MSHLYLFYFVLPTCRDDDGFRTEDLVILSVSVCVCVGGGGRRKTLSRHLVRAVKVDPEESTKI
jgi:hypothetical protein